jgi:DNA-binding IclR family transcriptional regulator
MSSISIPVRIETGALDRGEEAYWRFMLEADRNGPWTCTDIATRAGVTSTRVQPFLLKLSKGGYVERVGSRPVRNMISPGASAATWRVIRAVARAPRLDDAGMLRPETANQILWRTMKMLKRFTAQELVAAASSPERPINPAAVKVLLSHYKRAKIVTATGAGLRKTPATYTLTGTVSGDLAPQVCAARVVYDPNARAILTVETAGGDA